MNNRLDYLLNQEKPKSQRYWNKVWDKSRYAGGLVRFPLMTAWKRLEHHAAWIRQLPVQDTDMQGVVVQGEARVLSCDVLPDIEVVEIEDPSTGHSVLVQV